jgi:Protein of unknown function (DUF3684)
VLYDLEMINISKRYVPEKEDPSLVGDTIHLMNMFTFQTTTPSSRVRAYIEETFFSSSKDGTLALLSNKGVKPSKSVRIGDAGIPFLVNTPLLHDSMTLEAKGFVDRLKEAELLKVVGWDDIQSELNGRTLSETHGIQFLRWLLLQKYSLDIQNKLISSAVIIVGDEKLGKLVNLGQVSSFVVPGKIPLDRGLPISVLPFEIGKGFSARELELL